MTHKLTKKEVLNLYGIGSTTLEEWIRQGLPTAGKRKAKGKGGPARLFDPVKLGAWAGAHGKNPKGVEGAILKDAAGPGPDVPAPAPDTPRQFDMNTQLEAVRGQYRVMLDKFIRSRIDKSTASDIASISRALTLKGTELRQLEMSVLEWQKQTGALRNYAEMKRLFVEVASSTRERIMALPNELAPVLREYLRDSNDVGKVHDEIREAIAHALSALPSELPERKEK